MAVIINGSSGVTTPGISNSEGYTGDGLTIAAGAPSGAVQVDTSGNLGLGVTPSAWNYPAFQANRISVSSYSTGGGLSYNAFDSSTGWKYIASDYASHYQQNSGTHKWLTAPSGTAGNAISFTQAMTLDASGNLFVGQSSLPTGWSGITRSVSLKQGNASIIGFLANAYNSDRGIYMGHDGTIGAIGVSYGASGGYSPLTFWTSDTERARIDSSGNLLVGTTSQYGSGKVCVPYSSSAFGIVLQSTTSSGSNYAIEFKNSSGSGVGSIVASTTATSYNTSSDYRLKENVQPMTGALAKVAQLKPCTYKWKADGSDGEGFIAHELAEVVPQCVTGEKDAVEVVDVKDEDGNVIGTEERPVYQGIDTSFLIATLTAAIQEQQALIESLTARVVALEGAQIV